MPCGSPSLLRHSKQEAARAAAVAALQAPDVEQPGSAPGVQLEGADGGHGYLVHDAGELPCTEERSHAPGCMPCPLSQQCR